MQINLIELWANMAGLVKAVVIVLTIEALGCIYVTMDRLMLLFFSKRKAKKFARAVGSTLSSGDYPRALSIAREHGGSDLANYLVIALETFTRHRRTGHSEEKAAQLAGRALDRAADELDDSLHRGMNILATTGSTAPFIGLLGTVLGILNAFRLVGEQGSGGMGTIGVAIAEALIVTGYGLMVAIPAVILFNWLSSRITKYEAGLDGARSELVDRLEAGGTPQDGTDASDDAPEAAATMARRAVATA